MKVENAHGERCDSQPERTDQKINGQKCINPAEWPMSSLTRKEEAKIYHNVIA